MAAEPISWSIDGRVVPLQWETCTMSAPGGYDSLTALVPASRWSPAFTQGSRVMGIRPNGQVLWLGSVLAPAKVLGDTATFQAAGYSDVIRRRDTRLPFQIADASQWSEAHEQPFDYAFTETISYLSKNDSIGWTVDLANQTYTSQQMAGYALYVPDNLITNIGFTIRKSADDADFDVLIRRGNDLGTLTDETYYGLGAGNPDGTTVSRSLTGSANTITVYLRCNTASTAAGVVEAFWLDDLRVNVLGSDSFLTSDVVSTVASLVGFDQDITAGTISGMPLDYSGDWGALLDLQAAIEDWTWLVMEPQRFANSRVSSTASDPSYPKVYFREWGDQTWETTTQMAEVEGLVPAPLYNRVTTYFQRPAGVPQHRSLTPADLGVNDPIANSLVYGYPDPVTLPDPQRSTELADTINERLLTRLLEQRMQGSVTVRGLTKGKPFDIKAGDTLSVRGLTPECGPQRVVGVSYSQDGSVDVTLDRSFDVTALLTRLDRSRAWNR